MNSNVFNTFYAPPVKSNWQSLNHDLKMSFKMGGIFPIGQFDVLPGDFWKIQTQVMARFSPMIAPVMHDVKLKVFGFFVPNRLLWPNWEQFISNDESHLINEGGAAHIPPYLLNNGGFGDTWNQGSVADYMGVPDVPATTRVSAFPMAGFRLIYDEWFRDQDLQDKVFTELKDGDNTNENSLGAHFFGNTVETYFRIHWEHDYFTASRPWPQKGDPVQLPLLTGNATVSMEGSYDSSTVPVIRDDTGAVLGVTANDPDYWLSVNNGDFNTRDSGNNTNADAFFDPNGSLVVEINDQAVTINELREAFRMQEFLEIDTAGTRYVETLYNHFDVISDDARFNRPEFLGMTSQQMVISEVLQTAPSLDSTIGEGSVLGTTAGHGISIGGTKPLKYFAKEHGWLHLYIAAVPRASYQEGLARKWSREDRYDYGWPKLGHIGHQEVLNQELYAKHPSDPEGTWGYVPRYSEYRYEPSRVAGQMRNELSHWHLGRIFENNVPALNENFLLCTPSPRIFAVQYDTTGEFTADQIYAHIFHSIKVNRRLPKFGKPMI